MAYPPAERLSLGSKMVLRWFWLLMVTDNSRVTMFDALQQNSKHDPMLKLLKEFVRAGQTPRIGKSLQQLPGLSSGPGVDFIQKTRIRHCAHTDVTLWFGS
jgi:hypothetical protein